MTSLIFGHLIDYEALHQVLQHHGLGIGLAELACEMLVTSIVGEGLA